MIPDVFAMDTRSSGVSSDALDGIWEDSDDYKAKAATATERALALAAAADQGQGAFLKAVGGLGSACKVVMRTTEENSSYPDQTARALVWDLPLRLFHWALASAFVVSWVTAEAGIEWADAHLYSGYTSARATDL